MKASHGNVQKVISFLWHYSLIGYRLEGSFARFKHNSPTEVDYELPVEKELKNYYFLLHRGVFWKLTGQVD